MTDPRMELVIDGPVARLTIRRADKMNALDAEMVAALLPACRQIEQSAARVAIVTGEGEKSFSAGGDIAAWSGLSPEDFSRRWLRDGHVGLDALARLSIPVIAVLQGHCLGGGLELAACADYRIAEEHVRVGQPEPALGIIPGWSGTQRAARRFGAQIVRRMSLFGEVLDARQSLSLGIVDAVVPKGAGLNAAAELTQKVIDRSPRATEITKMMVNAAEGEESERIIDALAGAAAASSADLQEGLAAFREKRKPQFSA